MAIDVPGWVDYLIESEHADNTIKSYTDALKQYCAVYDEVSRHNVVEYKRGLIERGLAPKTVTNRVIALNQYAKWAGIECAVRPVKVQVTHSLENVITNDQKDALSKMLKETGRMNSWAMVELLSMTGVRVGELVQLKMCFIRDGSQTITNKGKTRKVFAPKRLREKVGPYFEERGNDWLFTAREGLSDKPITREGVGARLRKNGARVGIPKGVCHPHSFRHMFALNFMRANGDISLLADILGHSNLQTTQIYTRMTAEEQRKSIDEAVDW